MLGKAACWGVMLGKAACWGVMLGGHAGGLCWGVMLGGHTGEGCMQADVALSGLIFTHPLEDIECRKLTSNIGDELDGPQCSGVGSNCCYPASVHC